MIKVFFLNEISLLPFLWATLTGQKNCVASIDPLFKPFAGVFQSMAERAERRGQTEFLYKKFDELNFYKERPWLIHLANVFEKTEPWQNDWFRFQVADGDPDYGYAYKHRVCNYMNDLYFPLMALDILARNMAAGTYEAKGIDADLAGLYRAFRPKSKGLDFRTQRLPLVGVIKFFTVIGVILKTLFWILPRLRLEAPRENIFFAADYITDPREFRLFRAMKEGGRVLLLRRGPESNKIPGEDEFQITRQDDCVIGLKDFLPLIWILLRDTVALSIRYRFAEFPLFVDVLAMARKRVMIRAWISQWRPAFFYGRDDYNVDHIIRYQELRRRGGKSLGLIHAIPGIPLLAPVWRYNMFDIYYVYGQRTKDYYADTWPADMLVRTMRGFGISPELVSTVKENPSSDFAILTHNSVHQPELKNIITLLSVSYPGRKILIQVKEKYINLDISQDFLSVGMKNNANVEIMEGVASNFFPLAGYILSDSPTVVGEAIQCGRTAFYLDLIPEHEVNMLREFPGLCVSSAKEAVDRIKSIEAGEWHYPRDQYGGLVDLSGRDFLDMLKEDVGIKGL